MLFGAMQRCLDRRAALAGVVGLGGALITGPAAAQPRRRRALRPLDLNDARDHVYGFAKMWSTLGDAPVFGGYQGVQYAVVGAERARPLFGYCGFGQFQSRILEDGSARIIGKECGYFTDLETGDVLEEWDNPWTGERVRIFNFVHDTARDTIGLTVKRYRTGDEETVMNDSGGAPAADAPFRLPWQRIDDQYLLGWDYAHEYANPVTPEGWPRASTGPRVNPSEHFAIFTPADEIDDRSCPSARFHAGFTRQAPWWPWMMMGQSGVHGVLIGRMHSYKITGTHDDIPRKVLDYVERTQPDLLDPPQDGPDTGRVRGTLEAYAEMVAPETPGYVRR